MPTHRTENDKHTAEVESPEDTTGKTIQARYESIEDPDTLVSGGTTSGVAKGETISITTDTADTDIDTGTWRVWFTYEDGDTTRWLTNKPIETVYFSPVPDL